MNFHQAIRVILATARENKNLSIEALAETAGIPRETVRRKLLPNSAPLNTEELAQLAQALDLDIVEVTREASAMRAEAAHGAAA